METNPKPVLKGDTRRRFKRWEIWAIALISFVSGSLVTAHLTHMQEVRAESDRVFELMVYHTVPGGAVALESIFRDVSPLQAKHGLKAVGYWVPQDNPAWKDTFIYLVPHTSLEEARKNWEALHADPAFPPYRSAAAPLIEKVKGVYNVEEVYMRPTDYSPMK